MLRVIGKKQFGHIWPGINLDNDPGNYIIGFKLSISYQFSGDPHMDNYHAAHLPNVWDMIAHRISADTGECGP